MMHKYGSTRNQPTTITITTAIDKCTKTKTIWCESKCLATHMRWAQVNIKIYLKLPQISCNVQLFDSPPAFFAYHFFFFLLLLFALFLGFVLYCVQCTVPILLYSMPFFSSHRCFVCNTVCFSSLTYLIAGPGNKTMNPHWPCFVEKNWNKNIGIHSISQLQATKRIWLKLTKQKRCNVFRRDVLWFLFCFAF